ncbi:MAG: hypothetical protein IKQ97_04080 [Eubacterium sp.]|nr:hypothetical protein [Eubacterium sp.]
MTKHNKKHLAVILMVSLLLGLISVPTATKAVSKPKLSSKTVTVVKGDEATVKILGVKKSNINDVSINVVDDDIADAVNETKTKLTVYGYESGSTTIKVIIDLKKKNAGKKKYVLKLNVIVRVQDSSIYTQPPVQTTAPVSDVNGKVKYISDRSVEYNTEYSEHRVFFSLKDASESRVTGSGKAVIKITNEDGAVVYTQTKVFSQQDFSSWTSALNGTRLMCCLHILDSEIEKGTAKKGSLTLEVTLDNGFHFDEYKMSIGELPLVEATSVVKIELPQVPMTLHDYSYDNTIRYSYQLTDIRYTAEKNYSGSTYTVHVYYSGKKTYDYRGSGQSSMCTIAGKLYKANTSTVVDSASGHTPSIDSNDSFENVDATFYNIPAGDYKLEVLSTN